MGSAQARGHGAHRPVGEWGSAHAPPARARRRWRRAGGEEGRTDRPTDRPPDRPPAQPMWAGESPGVDPSPCSHSTEPASTAPPDSLRRDSPRAPSSLCSSPGLSSGSLPPDSLPAYPGLGSPRESPSVQCDSLECPCCCCCWSVGSVGICEDSLQTPLAVCNGRGCFGTHHRHPRASGDLSDSLESFGVQHDSLQSISSLSESFRSSSINSDSLESLSNLSSGPTGQHSGLEFTSQ